MDYADKVLGASPSTRLWLSAFWGFAYIFIALSAGRMTEKMGPRWVIGVMVLGAVLTSAFGLVAIAVPTVFVLVGIMLPFNVASSTIWPAIESAITRTKGTTRLSTRTAIYNLSWGSAGFVAFFTCGALEKWWWGTIFVVPAIVSAISLVVFYLWAVPASMVGKEHVPEEEGGEHEIDTPELRKRAQRLLLMAWIGNTLAYVAINVLIPVKMRLADLAGISNLATAGFITSIWGFTRFAGFALTWKWSGWHYKVRWLLGAQGALAVSFGCMLVVHEPLILVVMQIVFGVAAAMVYSSALYYAMHGCSDGHGGHAGIHEALIGLGIAIGPGIGALAGAGETGPNALLRISIGVSALLFLGVGAMAILAPRWGKVSV